MNAAIAETDIDEPSLIIEMNDQRQMIVARTPFARIRLPYLTRDIVDDKAETPQEFAKAAIELEAPAAAPLLDNLGIRPLDVGTHTATVKRVQILERYVHQMCKL